MSSKLGGSLKSAMQFAKREAVTHRNDGNSLLSLDKLVLPEQQPRRYFDKSSLDALTSSIKAKGILQPLLVRPLGSDRFEVVAGERRYRAAKAIGLESVPVFISALTDIEAKEAALTENLQREGINPVEETEAILELLALRLETQRAEVISILYARQNEQKGNSTHNVMGRKVEVIDKFFTDTVNMTLASFVSNRLPLLKLPDDILEALRRGEIAYTKASAVARIKDEDARKRLLKVVIEEKLSLEQVRAEVKKVLGTSASPHHSPLEQRMRQLPKLLKYAQSLKDAATRNRVEDLLSELETILWTP